MGEEHLGRQAGCHLFHLLSRAVPSPAHLLCLHSMEMLFFQSLPLECCLRTSHQCGGLERAYGKDLHGTPTQPSGGDSLSTLFLCSEPWFPPVYRGGGNHPPAPAEPGSQLGFTEMKRHLLRGHEDSTVKDRPHSQPWEGDRLAWESDSKATIEWAAGIWPQSPWAEHHAQRAVGTHKRTAVR